MKVAVVSDIHGNLPALEAVFADIAGQGLEEVYCLGDIVGYGPDVDACCGSVSDRCRVVLLGNHDDAVVGRTSMRWFNAQAARALAYARAVIAPENLSYLASLPYVHVTETLFLAHSTPVSPEDWDYLGPDNVLENLAVVGSRIGLVGHSHLQGAFVYAPDGRCRFVSGLDHPEDLALGERGSIIVAGSVGQPRDGDPRASYVVLDPDRRAVLFRRCAYPVEETQRRIREAGLPEALATRLGLGW
jgi:diadenosine tetraphosphatase ApaH/serine/threonine PP2A family protein phosphatase